MSSTMSRPDWLTALGTRLEQSVGLRFPPERHSEFVRGVEAAARDFKFADAASCANWLLDRPLGRRQIETLAGYLTVGETYFFRDPGSFDRLEREILSPLIQVRRATGKRLRLWSAGCASGEEAYSLAILLQRLLPDLAQWDISILGTDINPQMLVKARSGLYDRWSFRHAPQWLSENYFEPVPPEQHQLLPQVQHMVEFRYHNLAGEGEGQPEPGSVDILFCRNVLMYFAPREAARALQRMHAALSEGGWLILGTAETGLVPRDQFEPVDFSGFVLHRKQARNAVPLRPPARLPIRRRVLPELASEEPAFEEVYTDYLEGRYAAAQQAGLRRLAAIPHDLPTLFLMVRIHANQGEHATALQWCNSAIAANRFNPTGFYLLALLHQEQGRPERARQALGMALGLDPEFVMAHVAAAGICRRQGLQGEARQHAEQALALLDRCPPYQVLAESEGMTAGHLARIMRRFPEGSAVA